MITESDSKKDGKIWIVFLKNHWKISILFIIGIILAVIGAILTFLWFVGDAQSTGLVPIMLDSWTLGHFVSFVLYLLFWELLFIGIPVVITVGAIFFFWWKKLPEHEREEYKRNNLFGSKSKKSDKSGGISFLIFIAFIIKVFLDGNWNVPIASWTFDYLVYSFVWAFIWIVIIIGIPVGIGVLIWLYYKINKVAMT